VRLPKIDFDDEHLLYRIAPIVKKFLRERVFKANEHNIFEIMIAFYYQSIRNVLSMLSSQEIESAKKVKSVAWYMKDNGKNFEAIYNFILSKKQNMKIKMPTIEVDSSDASITAGKKKKKTGNFFGIMK